MKTEVLIETQFTYLSRSLTDLSGAQMAFRLPGKGGVWGTPATAPALGPKGSRVPQQEAGRSHSQCFDSQGDKQRYRFQRNILGP